jgi:hypothetical protein
MICSHFFEVAGEAGADVVSSMPPGRSADSITMPQQGEALQPFCGALIRTSTPRPACRPRAAGGDAVQHQQPAHLVHGVGHLADVVVGQHDPGGGLHMRAKTMSGRSARMVATTSSMGAGAKGEVGRIAVRRAFSTVRVGGISPISKIWLQR